MDKEYILKKKSISKNQIDTIQIYFKDGEFFSIKKNEVCDILLNLNDELVIIENEINYSIETGFIKLRINFCKRASDENINIYKRKEYINNRKEYIERKCCIENSIKYIKIFNNYGDSSIFSGDITSRFSDGFLFIEYNNINNKYTNNKDYSSIMLKEINKNDIDKIFLNFENCEGFEIFNSEILDINLNLKREFKFEYFNLFRIVEDGYIKLKLEKDNNRNIDLYQKRVGLETLKKRLYGKDCGDYHDICNLYITFKKFDGYFQNERIIIEDIRDDEIKNMEENSNLDNELDDDFEDNYWFIGGYAKKNADGTILITFGKEKAL